MIRETDVRERLAAFLLEEVSLDTFEDWLVAESWNMHQDSTVEVQDLVSSIELAFSERSNGHLNDAEFRGALHAMLDEIVVSLLDDPLADSHRVPHTAATSFQVPPVSLPQPA